jgi:hypothetical protein
MHIDLNEDKWPPAGCPALAWPVLLQQDARLNWYQEVIAAYAALWAGHVSQARLAPVSEAALSELESRLGCTLPLPLREYQQKLGALSLAEGLCSVNASDRGAAIEPLLDAYPGIVELTDNKAELLLAKQLVAFGDYLGNGNMFCFHRESGEVYYFDHDDGEILTRFFPSVECYLDALMILCLAEVYEDDDAGEALLVERFGPALVKKWQY